MEILVFGKDTYPMLLLGTILAIGLLLGWGLGGGIRNLSDVGIRLWWIAPVALVLQAAPLPRIDGEWGRLLPVAGLLLSYLLLVVVVVANWRLRGFILILLGLLMNMTVIAANQGMPVSADALAEVGHLEDAERLRDAQPGSKHRLARDDDVLLPLADVIPVGEPFDVVLSIGDAFAYVGGGVFLSSAMLRRPRRDPEPEEPPNQPATWS